MSEHQQEYKKEPEYIITEYQLVRTEHKEIRDAVRSRPHTPAPAQEVWAIRRADGEILYWTIRTTREESIYSFGGNWAGCERVDGYRCIRVLVTPVEHPTQQAGEQEQPK